jgi:hypothetical protein
MGELAQEFFSGTESQVRRFPLECLEVDTTEAINVYAFLEKKALLLFIALAPFEGDTAAAVDDSVPGKAVLIGRRVKNPDDLAGSAVVSRKSGDLSIGRNLAARDRLDRVLSFVLKLHYLPF